jgi:hypothetical protein
MSGGREDFVAIAETVQTYVEGMAGADETKLRAAFHAQASIIGHFEGEFEWDSLDAFIKAVKSVVDTPDPNPEWTLQSVDIVGDSAVARAGTAVAGMSFTDTLSLLRIDGNWVIVAKTYFQRADG